MFKTSIQFNGLRTIFAVGLLFLGSQQSALAVDPNVRPTCQACTTPNVGTYLNQQITSNTRDTAKVQAAIARLNAILSNPDAPVLVNGQWGNADLSKIQEKLQNKQTDLNKLIAELAQLNQYVNLNNLNLLALTPEERSRERGDRDDRHHGRGRDRCEFDFLVLNPEPTTPFLQQQLGLNNPVEKFMFNGNEVNPNLNLDGLQFVPLNTPDNASANLANVSELPPGVRFRTNIFLVGGGIRVD